MLTARGLIGVLLVFLVTACVSPHRPTSTVDVPENLKPGAGVVFALWSPVWVPFSDMRITEAERDALKAAAQAAFPVLTKLKEERDELSRRITTLESIISSYEDALGGSSPQSL